MSEEERDSVPQGNLWVWRVKVERELGVVGQRLDTVDDSLEGVRQALLETSKTVVEHGKFISKVSVIGLIVIPALILFWNTFIAPLFHKGTP